MGKEKQITSIYELRDAMNNRKAVHCPNARFSKRHFPAAFMMNLTGSVLIRLFESGMFIYEKKGAEN